MPAHALDLGRPEVSKGATELRNVNTIAWERGDGGSQIHLHEFHIGYAFTDSLALKGILTLEGSDANTTSLSLGSVEGTYEFADIETSGFGLAWYTIVDMGIDDAAMSDVVFGPILKLHLGKIDIVTNTYAIRPFGENGTSGIDVTYAWLLTYEVSKHLTLGVEGDGGMSHIFHAEPLRDQVHRIGPVIFTEFHVGERLVTLDIGLQFGLTNPSPDTEAKVILGTVF